MTGSRKRGGGMENWKDELKTVLESERNLLNELTKLAEDERGMIIRGDVEHMSGCLNEQMPLLMQLEQMEDRRLRVLEKAGFGADTLSEVAKRAGDAREEFMTLLDSMGGISESLKRLNELNGRLVRSRLELYEAMRCGSRVTYGVDGVPEQKQQIRGLIDQKA